MISEVIKTRRAVFPAQYNNEKITNQEIEKVLESANWAPTHKRTEPWRFRVYKGASQIKLAEVLAETYKNNTEFFSEFKYNKYRTNPKKAGCVIAICMQRDASEIIPEWEEIAATAMAVQNMWLTAHEMNIGAYWGSPSIVKYMNDFFNMKEGERCLGFFYMGKYDKPLEEGLRNSKIEDKTIWY